ncbi:cytochrome-c oxidase, cbb3-type subunit III [uncultured Tateyamaria sp.]|uniref:cytochrome-c oxidase, cbb3-type subunit III n=1 Tax=uncultured Tateyamaria sp. TaxID=455651 RepID=UPI00262C7B5A|nr:cytochrome-c oxidase, cbb3-type subunit III [uncultured Tateyamaria sp.]
MSKPERDPYTGLMTTGHEWNGIKELMTPVPRPVKFFLATTILLSVLLWILYPTWPYGPNYTKGVLGVDQRTIVEENLSRSAALRMVWEEKFTATDMSELEADDGAMTFVRSHGARLFEDNCSACHGLDASGGPGFPSLTDDQWLWGGDADTILETLRVGINTSHDETRYAEMLAFGDQGILDSTERRALTTYVISLSRPDELTEQQTEGLPVGQELFLDNCSSCHGDDGGGILDVGAPNLTDDFWIYGGDAESIAATLRHGRIGVMPYWEDRLSEADRRLLTLYIRDLGPKPQ